MKRIVVLLLINLSIAICGFSQNTYPRVLTDSTVEITNEQLKQTNLVFLEHHKLTLENKDLKSKINLLDSIIVNNNKIDSLRVIDYTNLQTDYESLRKKCKVSRTKSFLTGSLIGVAITSIIAILIK